jgi:hypothetical protein
MSKVSYSIVMAAIALAVFITKNSRCQNVEFTYDASGNRISQQVVYLKTVESDPQDSTSQFRKPEIPEPSCIGGLAFRVFPNPTPGSLTVTTEGDASAQRITMTVSTLSGGVIWQCELPAREQPVDLSPFENGVYILSVRVDQESKTWKIIKQ